VAREQARRAADDPRSQRLDILVGGRAQHTRLPTVRAFIGVPAQRPDSQAAARVARIARQDIAQGPRATPRGKHGVVSGALFAASTYRLHQRVVRGRTR
jgi:hypothetical protein